MYSVCVSILRTCNGALLADEVGLVVSCEVLVEHAVKTARLVLVPVDAVFDMLWGISREVVCE